MCGTGGFGLRGKSSVVITPTIGCTGRLSSISVYQPLTISTDWLKQAHRMMGKFGLPASLWPTKEALLK
jgi:hypothetical protein